MMKKLASLLMSLALLSACVCGAAAEAAPQPENFADSAARLSLEGYLESDPELTALMEKSLALAHEINLDPVTNPVDSVDKLLDYVDWLTTCIPWNVLTEAEYPTLYGHIDQSIDYIWSCSTSRWRSLRGWDITIPRCSTTSPFPPGSGSIPTNGALFFRRKRAGTIFITGASKTIPA